MWKWKRGGGGGGGGGGEKNGGKKGGREGHTPVLARLDAVKHIRVVNLLHVGQDEPRQVAVQVLLELSQLRDPVDLSVGRRRGRSAAWTNATAGGRCLDGATRHPTVGVRVRIRVRVRALRHLEVRAPGGSHFSRQRLVLGLGGGQGRRQTLDLALALLELGRASRQQALQVARLARERGLRGDFGAQRRDQFGGGCFTRARTISTTALSTERDEHDEEVVEYLPESR